MKKIENVYENIFEITMMFCDLQNLGEVKSFEEIGEELGTTISPYDAVKDSIYNWATEFAEYFEKKSEELHLDYIGSITEFACQKIQKKYGHKYSKDQREKIDSWIAKIGRSDLTWCDLDEYADGQLLEATKCFDSLYDYEAWQHLQIATGTTIPIEMARKINGMLYENNIEVLELHSSTLKDCYEKIILENDVKLKAKEELKIYSKPIMEAIRQRMDLEEDDTSRDAEIMEMDKEDVFRGYLEWEGIIGYTSKLMSVFSEIFNVDLDY